MTQTSAAVNEDRLGIVVAGLGCLGATFIAGTLLLRKGLLPPDGSLTQTASGGVGGDGAPPATLGSVLGLAPLDGLVFGAWSIFPDTALEIAQVWSLLDREQLEAVADEMAAIEPMKGVFDADEILDELSATYIKIRDTKAELATALEEDLAGFQSQSGCRRAVVVWCGSTERTPTRSASHRSVEAFEAGLRANDPAITSSQIYAWACARRGVPFACGSPNGAIGFDALEELAASTGTPLAGECFRPARYHVLDTGAAAPGAEDAPPPCAWKEPLRHPMNEEIIHPSIRAAAVAVRDAMPIEDSKRTALAVLDVALLMDWARRAGLHGTQRWLDVFFSAPAGGTPPDEQPGALRNVLAPFLKTLKPANGDGRV
jgi:hypothetical protein